MKTLEPIEPAETAAPARAATTVVSKGTPAPRLTVAIPTRNRAQWLGRCLQALLREVAAVPAGRVEVVVSDNASTDGTWAMLTALARVHPVLYPSRNEADIGPEANFRRLYGMGRGDYLWLLGDDDIVLPGALARILARIDRGYDYVALSVLEYDETLTRCLRDGSRGRRRDRDLGGPGEALRHLLLNAGFISANVMRRDLFGTLPEGDFARFTPWGMAFLMDVYAGLTRIQKGVLTCRPALKARRAEATEYGATYNYFAVFFEGPDLAFRELRDRYGYPARDVRRAKGRLLRRLAWRRLAFERLTGRLDVDEARRILRGGYGSYVAFWLLCAPLLYLPGTGALVRLGLRLAGGERGRRLLERAPRRHAMPTLIRFVDDTLPGVALRLRRAKHRLGASMEMAVMRRYVGRGDLVLDIGARRGLFAAYLADLVGPEGAVEAFEPFPPNVAALRRLFAARPQVRLHAVALSAAHRTATLTVPLEGGHPNTALGSLEPGRRGADAVTVEVPCRRLDDLLSGRTRPVRFVKCDVEGHELAVFRGASRVLMADRPVVLAEIEQRHTDEPIASRFDFFASLGYTAWFLARGRPPRPVAEFDPARHQAPAGTGAYVNMFLFLPGAEGSRPLP